MGRVRIVSRRATGSSSSRTESRGRRCVRPRPRV